MSGPDGADVIGWTIRNGTPIILEQEVWVALRHYVLTGEA